MSRPGGPRCAAAGVLVLLATMGAGCGLVRPAPGVDGAPPPDLAGTFVDDYGLRYVLSKGLWHQLPRARYHVLRWHAQGQYAIARNDVGNPGEPGRYSRIDWMRLPTGDWPLAFCLTAYDAPTPAAAEATPPPDRAHPRTGCNGFPFSRLRRLADDVPPMPGS